MKQFFILAIALTALTTTVVAAPRTELVTVEKVANSTVTPAVKTPAIIFDFRSTLKPGCGGRNAGMIFFNPPVVWTATEARMHHTVPGESGYPSSGYLLYTVTYEMTTIPWVTVREVSCVPCPSCTGEWPSSN